MTTSTPTVTQLAEDAEFELEAAKNHLEWIAAIARAIARDTQHGCRDIKALSELAKYLDDTGMTSVDAAIDSFRKISADSAEVS